MQGRLHRVLAAAHPAMPCCPAPSSAEGCLDVTGSTPVQVTRKTAYQLSTLLVRPRMASALVVQLVDPEDRMAELGVRPIV